MDLTFTPLHIRMLQKELGLRKKRNPRYSLRAFAQFLGIGSSTLSRILMNAQDISLVNSKLIMEKLDLSENERMLFVASIAEEKRKRSFELLDDVFAGKTLQDETTSQYYSISAEWLLSKSPEMIFVVNKSFECIYANDEAAKLHGLKPQQLIGLTMRDVGVPEHLVNQLEDLIKETFLNKKISRIEVEYPLGQEAVWMERIYIPIMGRNQEVDAVACHIRDISERKKTESQLRFLVDMGEILSSSYDYTITLETVVDKIITQLADGCFVHILNKNHEAEIFKVAHREEEKKVVLSNLFSRFPYDPHFPGFYHKVFKTGKLQFFPRVDEDLLRQFCRNKDHYETLRNLNVYSYLCVPMKAVNKIIGTMSLIRSPGQKPFDQNELSLVLELSTRAAWAIDCSMKLSRSIGTINELKDS